MLSKSMSDRSHFRREVPGDANSSNVSEGLRLQEAPSQCARAPRHKGARGSHVWHSHAEGSDDSELSAGESPHQAASVFMSRAMAAKRPGPHMA